MNRSVEKGGEELPHITTENAHPSSQELVAESLGKVDLSDSATTAPEKKDEHFRL